MSVLGMNTGDGDGWLPGMRIVGCDLLCWMVAVGMSTSEWSREKLALVQALSPSEKPRSGCELS